MRLKVQTATATDAVDTAQANKIGAQHLAALACQHAGGHIKPMVQARIGIEVVQRAQRARLGIGRAIHATPHARVNHKPRAHTAGLERHIDRAIGKAPAPKRLSGGTQPKLGMSRGSWSSSRRLCALATISPARTTTAPIGTSPTAAAVRASASASRNELLVDFGDRHRSPSLLQIQNDAIITTHGEMAERLNAAVLKTVERESVPGVRIPLSPPP